MPKKLEQARILVTGGAGFIGSNLVERLLANGNEVVALDNFATGRRENLAPFLPNPAFRLEEGDIRDPAACRRAVDGADFVLHHAALGSVPRSIDDPAATTQVNIDGFVNVLLAARDAKVRRVVYASSSSVYGDAPESPKREEKLGRPLSPYAISKYANELYAENFFRLFGLEIIGLRYFNVFGRRQDPNGAYAAAIPKFALALLRHESPVIFGDGSSSRDFTYIDNVLQANERALLTSHPAAPGSVCNIACGQETTLNELFALLRQNLAAADPAIVAIEPVHGPLRLGDIPHSLADISRARALLDYRPEFDVAAGLRETAGYYAALSVTANRE